MKYLILTTILQRIIIALICFVIIPDIISIYLKILLFLVLTAIDVIVNEVTRI